MDKYVKFTKLQWFIENKVWENGQWYDYINDSRAKAPIRIEDMGLHYSYFILSGE